MGQKSAFYVLVFTYIWKNNGYDMILWLAGLDGIAGNCTRRRRWMAPERGSGFGSITAPGA